MRFSFASSATINALLASVFLLGGCSGDVAVGSSDNELQTQANGEPTGDGSTCSWEGTTLRPADNCEAVPTPSGYGPYAVGEDFPAPDGCNECSCTERGIMCTVLECTSEGGLDADPVVCTDDAKICTDGSSVGREGPDCEFAPCPNEAVDDCSVACTLDAQICPDGSSVGRTGPDCEFAPCPDEEPVVCTHDAMECPDGSLVGRSGPDCEFVCPDEVPVVCTGDVKECADGSYVSRTAPDCEFAPCPYDPCADKACGDSCTLCAPDDADCGEIAVVKFCNEEGLCDIAEPACL